MGSRMMSAGRRGATILTLLLLAASAAIAQDMQSIQPGMTTDEVKAAFGEPDGTSTRGDFTFYFYNNACERDCGFPDVVFFQFGQVVDAVLRATWRDYNGESSSPKGVVPRANPGGERLQIPTQVESIEVRPVQRQVREPASESRDTTSRPEEDEEDEEPPA